MEMIKTLKIPPYGDITDTGCQVGNAEVSSLDFVTTYSRVLNHCSI